MRGLRCVSPSHSPRARWAAQAQVGARSGCSDMVTESPPPACSRGKGTWPGEKWRQAQTSLGRINGSTLSREAARNPDRPVCGVALECAHAGKPLVDGMLLKRVGPAALFCLPAASTPCMGGLLCAPSGEVGRRGNFCLLCVFLSSFWRGGGGSTTRGHRNDLEVSRTYGNTQISTSRMLRKYLVYGTP